MNYCPVCTRPIRYTSTLLRGRKHRPIWCEHCGVGLEKERSFATWAVFIATLIVNIAAPVLGFGFATLPFFAFDLYLDAATLKLAPIRLDES